MIYFLDSDKRLPENEKCLFSVCMTVMTKCSEADNQERGAEGPVGTQCYNC